MGEADSKGGTDAELAALSNIPTNPSMKAASLVDTRDSTEVNDPSDVTVMIAATPAESTAAHASEVNTHHAGVAPRLIRDVNRL
ncbi:hypothetical protein GCM10009724_26710 [Microbacterium lacticum]|uniref:hypothetical protein n=1 Tax=Microbacterium lacticum TaxID=33885 RepID=UPI00115129F0|nr:hypothetical protein [Microbacterium lacticum]GEB96451.1 hypothetical protein MLA01_26700 [Microbacterium lacticum]GGI74328.1 hypothetical protein GCM10009724_26710 [Microbacterium lacticum]